MTTHEKLTRKKQSLLELAEYPNCLTINVTGREFSKGR